MSPAEPGRVLRPVLRWWRWWPGQCPLHVAAAAAAARGEHVDAPEGGGPRARHLAAGHDDGVEQQQGRDGVDVGNGLIAALCDCLFLVFLFRSTPIGFFCFLSLIFLPKDFLMTSDTRRTAGTNDDGGWNVVKSAM